MAVLLGMLAGALLVFGAALASIWLQQVRATRADQAGTPTSTGSRPNDRRPPPTDPGPRLTGPDWR